MKSFEEKNEEYKEEIYGLLEKKREENIAGNVIWKGVIYFCLFLEENIAGNVIWKGVIYFCLFLSFLFIIFL